MTVHYALKATKRDQAGKGAARALRRENRVPAVIYGGGKAPLLLSLPEKEINIEYNRAHMFTNLCDMDVDGQKKLLLAREVQLHPVKGTVEHVDFLRVMPKTRIAVFVPVKFINEDKCPSIHNKGSLNITRHEVEMNCIAMDIPEYMEVDLTGKEHGDAVRFSDAIPPKGAKPVITNRDFTIATLVAPKVALTAEEMAAAAEAAAAAAKPAGKKKK